jgi:hypothetical protein
MGVPANLAITKRGKEGRVARQCDPDIERDGRNPSGERDRLDLAYQPARDASAALFRENCEPAEIEVVAEMLIKQAADQPLLPEGHNAILPGETGGHGFHRLAGGTRLRHERAVVLCEGPVNNR